MLNNSIYRIIDANLNRASEGLRVLEDWTRFRDQPPKAGGQNLLNEKLKNIRHGINQSFSPFTNLILSRESVNDPGRYIENPPTKQTVKEVIRANCKRLEESLRVLSEYGQLLQLEDAEIKKLENFRYEIYTIEKELLINEKLIRLNNSKLYLVAGRDAPSGHLYDDKTLLSIIERSIEGGVDIVQLRVKNEKEDKILGLAKEIKKIILNTNVLFIVNDRLDLALASEADGVHLGQNDMPINISRLLAPEGFIIGLSTHSIEQGKRGIKSGADYLGIGPVFSTPTKAGYKPCGLEYVGWAKDNLKEIPWFAIGGINHQNINKVIEVGAGRIAVVRAIMNSNDPLTATKSLKDNLNCEYAKIR